MSPGPPRPCPSLSNFLQTDPSRSAEFVLWRPVQEQASDLHSNSQLHHEAARLREEFWGAHAFRWAGQPHPGSARWEAAFGRLTALQRSVSNDSHVAEPGIFD